MSHHTMYIAAAILAVIVARRYNPVIGGVLGMVVPIGVGLWGFNQMSQGGTIAIGPIPLSTGAFVGIVIAWFIAEGFGVWRAINNKPSEEPDSGE